MFGGRISKAVAAIAAALTLTAQPVLLSRSAMALSLYDEPKYAAILIDAKTNEVLYARRPDAIRQPASITKVMTLYLAFDALASGKLKMSDRVPISTFASRQAPSKLGLPAGASLRVDDAIRVIAVKSANDIAVALAEKLGGSEKEFAKMMTRKAQQLGMMHTTFLNASGLPNPGHVTTARDIAKLSRAMIVNYPQYYAYFSQQTFAYGKQRMINHNHLLGKVPGVDGIKTGYTAAAGFTLAASAERNGKRLIAVVLGGPSTLARNENVTALLNAGFDVLKSRALGQRMTVAANLKEPNDPASLMTEVLVEQGSGDDSVAGGPVRGGLTAQPRR